MNRTRKNVEKQFHDEYVSRKRDLRSAQEGFYLEEMRSIEFTRLFTCFGPLNGKSILVYGSGGHYSLLKEFASRGAKVTAIDISPETVKTLQDQVRKNHFSDRCNVVEMDCEFLNFDARSFDLVFGRSILHHLDIEKGLFEISRVLKPRGKAFFIEPLATNPIIELYRRFTPWDRTPDEHPLRPKDLKVFSRYFKTRFQFLYALTLLCLVPPKSAITDSLRNKFFHLLYTLDDCLLSLIPFYYYLCWDVIIECEQRP